MNASVRIAPSRLSADFARRGEEVSAVIAAGADLIHFDVMDNHCVPNLTIGPQVCQPIKPHCFCAPNSASRSGTIPIDVHLMARPVDDLIAAVAQAGASIVSLHPEASEHLDRSLQLSRSFGLKAGLVLNPATPLHCLDHLIDRLDPILLMSVNPGFGGQGFIEATLPKIEAVRRRIDAPGRDISLEVDGGVKADNAERIGSAGAGTLVTGSAVFNGGKYQQAIHAIRAQASAGRQARVTLQ